MERKYNMRSPAVKRLMREAIELRSPTTMYFAQPLEENLFEWHFTILGPEGSEFEGGMYHGRIVLPSEYPMKPPSIILLTPNGRFELHQKICLSASSYHPELWQPSWSIRTVLLAIIGFMPTDGVGAIGSMDCSPEERKKMAQRSLNWTCSVCVKPNREQLLSGEDGPSQQKTMEEAVNIVSQMSFQSEDEVQQRKKLEQQQKAADVTTHPTSSSSSSSSPSAPSLPSQLNSQSSHAHNKDSPAIEVGGVSSNVGGVSSNVGGATLESSETSPEAPEVTETVGASESSSLRQRLQPHSVSSPSGGGGGVSGVGSERQTQRTPATELNRRSQAGWLPSLLLFLIILSLALLVARRLVMILL